MVSKGAAEDKYFPKMLEGLNINNNEHKISRRRSLSKKNRPSDQINNIKNKLPLAKYMFTSADIWSGEKKEFL